MSKFIMSEDALNHVSVAFDEIRITPFSAQFYYEGKLMGTKDIRVKMHSDELVLADLDGKFKVDIPNQAQPSPTHPQTLAKLYEEEELRQSSARMRAIEEQMIRKD